MDSKQTEATKGPRLYVRTLTQVLLVTGHPDDDGAKLAEWSFHGDTSDVRSAIVSDRMDHAKIEVIP